MGAVLGTSPGHPKRHPYSCLFLLRRSALFLALRGTSISCLWGSRTHNAGVVGSSPTPAIDEPITYGWLARVVLRWCTQNCTHFARFFLRVRRRLVELRRDLLPPQARTTTT